VLVHKEILVHKDKKDLRVLRVLQVLKEILEHKDI
jgi:hypothetical protein